MNRRFVKREQGENNFAKCVLVLDAIYDGETKTSSAGWPTGWLQQDAETQSKMPRCDDMCNHVTWIHNLGIQNFETIHIKMHSIKLNKY